MGMPVEIYTADKYSEKKGNRSHAGEKSAARQPATGGGRMTQGNLSPPPLNS